MDIANEACPASVLDFNIQNAEIKARDIGCGNINGQNIQVYGYNNISGPARSSNDVVTDREVISWLSPYSVDYFLIHEKARSQRAEHTGKWFFNTMKYKLWATVGFGKYRNLECIGIPGAGKTTMAYIYNLSCYLDVPNMTHTHSANVVKSLQHSFLAKRGLDIVLYVYFRHDTQAMQTIPFVLASLLLQVIKQKRKVSTHMRQFYDDYSSHKDMSPSTDIMVTLLRSELSGFGRAYIIVDALDEFSLPDYSLSYPLVNVLQRLNARLLITSRYAVGFTPNMFSTLFISAHADDIRIFIQKHLSGHLATVVARTPGLLEEIVRAIVMKSAGMFIVATLLVTCIPNSQPLTANELRAAVKKLPTGIEATYEMAMKRIQDQEPQLAELGKQALNWVYCSKRRLTVMELRHALSFQRSRLISEDDLIGEDRIRSACAGLISFVKLKDKQKNVVCQFSHFTAREFLATSRMEHLPEGEHRIVETCLGYLAAAVSGVPPDITKAAQQNYCQNTVWQNYCRGRGFALAAYAMECWADHARAIDEAFNLDVGASLFKHPISPYIADENTTLIHPTDSMTPEHYWMLYFTRYGMLTHLQKHINLASIDQSPRKLPVHYDHVQDRRGRTALHFSAWGGHPTVVEFFLDNGADVNLLSNFGRSPLHFAVQAGSPGFAMVQLLLSRGVVVDQPDHLNRAPIFYAIEPSWTSKAPSPNIIRLLLQHEVNIYRADTEHSDTPFSLAQRNENPRIKQLLEEYANTHPPQLDSSITKDRWGSPGHRDTHLADSYKFF